MAEVHWKTAVKGDFGTAADWGGGAVPGPTDDAILDAAGSPYTVTASTSQSVNSIQTTAAATLVIDSAFDAAAGTGAGANAGVILVDGTLTAGGALDNASVIQINGLLTVAASGLTLSGGGGLTLDATGDAIEGAAGGTSLTNIDNTIAGKGNFQQVAVTNQADGIINASGGTITFEPGVTVTNAGAIEAFGDEFGSVVFNNPVDNSGSIAAAGPVNAVDLNNGGVNTGVIESSAQGSIGISGVLDQTGGGILLDNASFDLYSATISGGALESSDGNYFAFTGSSVLDGTTQAVNIDGGISVNSGSLTLEGAIDNGGEILAGNLVIGSAGATLTGAGAVRFGGGEVSQGVIGQTSTSTLSNVDNRIELAGAVDLGEGSMTLVNGAGGHIAGAGTIDTGSITIVNAGAINARGRGRLIVKSPVDNSGKLKVDGGVLRIEGAISGSGAVMIEAGTLNFRTDFQGNVSFTGTSGNLVLAHSQSYTGTISGFSHTGGDAIDLQDMGQAGPVTLRYSGDASSGVLTVTDGTNTSHINFSGDYTTASFVITSQPDAMENTRPGTWIADPAPSATSFASAMAGLGARSAAGAHAPIGEPLPASSLLARPAVA